MDDLISRAAALDVLVTSPNFHTTLTRIEELPAVDAVPVVRCRDCRYWGTPFDINDTGFMVAHCEHFDESHAFSEQFYCASGERRDGE